MEKPRRKFDLDLIDRENAVASATEYTGLMQIPPENEWEREAYEDIYDMPKARKTE